MKADLNQPTFSLPNLFHLLPDGFREGEVFVLDVFDCHCPPITAEFKITLELTKNGSLLYLIKSVTNFIYLLKKKPVLEKS